MDKQAHLEREATQRRQVLAGRHARYTNAHANLRLRWPLARRSDDRKAA